MEMEYSKYVDGEFTKIPKIDVLCRMLKGKFEDQNDRIKRLMLENKKLKENVFKDEYIQKLEDGLEKVQREMILGFPISEKENKEIKEWITNHKCGRKGCYTYKFYPSSIGVFGSVVCDKCNEEFEFQTAK